jgi:ligand-binding sensor domain-containing protein
MNFGLFMIENTRVNDDSNYLTQVKVPRNDGTNLADYLLSGLTIRDIVVDGGNRKWIATQGSGIYLISSDNMSELAHYTTENSPILSDNVMALAINNETGELFIGTDIGLCSYVTDATTAVETMEKDNVYAYPNPVVSGYNGLITIVGLSRDADVKILSTSGQLVAQGRSNGGTFTWNGRDRQGRRVASGVYMVAAATSEGKKGTVCKIAVIN